MKPLVVAGIAAGLLSLSACGHSAPPYDGTQMEDAYDECGVQVAVSHGTNADLIGCMHDKLPKISLSDAKAYAQKREKEDGWLEQSPGS